MSVSAIAKCRANGGATLVRAKAAAASEGRGQVTLGELAMSVVHDLRNPLAAVYIGAEMLNQPGLSESEIRKLARNVHGAAQRIQQLLQDYVDLCRSAARRAHAFDLCDVVSEAVEAIAGLAEAQGVVVEQTVPRFYLIVANDSQVRSVLSNLLTNALDAMPEGGSIFISAVAEERSLVIRIADTGPGIAPQIRDHLFEPFVTYGKPKGWGLGLSSARRIVAENGGAMWLESSSESGTCFAFTLPLADRVCSTSLI